MVIGLADHGSVDGMESLRTLFNQHGIVVFPGFEIASSERFTLYVCSMRVFRVKRYMATWGH